MHRLSVDRLGEVQLITALWGRLTHFKIRNKCQVVQKPSQMISKAKCVDPTALYICYLSIPVPLSRLHLSGQRGGEAFVFPPSP